MTDRIPSGTRDVLSTEMRELRRITDSIRGVFERSGYGEVYTPALEFETTFERAAWSGGKPAYRVFDEQGQVMVLRSDMTVPIARVAANRFQNDEPPLRFSYFAHAYRGVKPQRGQRREFLQAGVELLGAPAPVGTAEALSTLCEALDAVELESYRVGLGDVSLYPALLAAYGVSEPEADAILDALSRGDFVEIEQKVRSMKLAQDATELLIRVPRTRGGHEVLNDLDGPLHEAVTGMREIHALLAPEVAARVIFDFGLARNFGYYTGAFFEVYDPLFGEPLGSGGRYDELLAHFGRPLPAVGWALDVERLHIALEHEQRVRV